MKDNVSIPTRIESKILTVRNLQVMIDRDLAELYEVETKVLNQAVKRNIERFPQRFMFQLTVDEAESIASSRSQIVTLNKSSNKRGSNIKYLPYAFTEQGCAMLSSVLKSDIAVQVSIRIMDAFIALRHFTLSNAQMFQRLDNIEKHQLSADNKIEELFERMDKYKIDDTQGIFFQGQIFDAYAKFESFLRSAVKEIILIDNYVDLSVLERLSKKKSGVNVTIYTDTKTKLTQQDIQMFNAQYPTLTLNRTTKMHDRFLIIDGKTLYHIGASLKDLGKKCFAFETLDSTLIPILMNNL